MPNLSLSLFCEGLTIQITCELPTNSVNAVLYLAIWWSLALQMLLFVSVLLRRVCLFIRTQLFASVRGRLLQARSRLPEFSNLSVEDLSFICRNNVLDLLVYLFILGSFDDASDLDLFFERILAFVQSREALKQFKETMEKKAAAAAKVEAAAATHEIEINRHFDLQTEHWP